MDSRFEDIRPYNDREAQFVLSNLFEDKGFQKALNLIANRYPMEQMKEEFEHFHSIYDFQSTIVKRFIDFFLGSSTASVSYSGIENLQPDKQYLFIANHRDIVIDTALLQNYFFEKGINSTKIAFGDNLLSSPTLTAFAKVNKLFMVKRGGSPRERLANSQLLSEYIHHIITEENESVWIAQRNGRTKNGIDLTQQGLVKMLGSYARPQFIEGLQTLNIVPVTVSYEYESCDRLKARELALSEDSAYVKKPGEDFDSMKQGIVGYKGRVHFVIGHLINDEIGHISKEIPINEQAMEVCHLIDKQIYDNYTLFPNNYIAYDLQENSNEFADHYTDEQKAAFIDYLHKQSANTDVPPEKMMLYLLDIYGNPVRTHYDKPVNISTEEHYL